MNIGWWAMSSIPNSLLFFILFFIGLKPLLECINTCWDFLPNYLFIYAMELKVSWGTESPHESQLKIFLHNMCFTNYKLYFLVWIFSHSTYCYGLTALLSHISWLRPKDHILSLSLPMKWTPTITAHIYTK